MLMFQALMAFAASVIPHPIASQYLCDESQLVVNLVRAMLRGFLASIRGIHAVLGILCKLTPLSRSACQALKTLDDHADGKVGGPCSALLTALSRTQAWFRAKSMHGCFADVPAAVGILAMDIGFRLFTDSQPRTRPVTSKPHAAESIVSKMPGFLSSFRLVKYMSIRSLGFLFCICMGWFSCESGLPRSACRPLR